MDGERTLPTALPRRPSENLTVEFVRAIKVLEAAWSIVPAHPSTQPAD
jgi:hypothetical protein